MRSIAPFNMTEKLTTEDLVIGGKLIPKDTEVALVIGSANRDPARFDDPATFDIGRRRINNFAFGFGAHFCVGHYVARQVAQVTVEELFPALAGPAIRSRSRATGERLDGARGKDAAGGVGRVTEGDR